MLKHFSHFGGVVVAAVLAIGSISRAAAIVDFNFEDSPGTTTTDGVGGVTLTMKNSAGTATDFHGASGSGVGGVGRALDFSSNTAQGAAGPGAAAVNVGTLGLGSVNQLTATFWIKSDTLMPSNKAPRYVVVGQDPTSDVTGANAFGVQNNNNDFTNGTTPHQNQTAVFVNGTQFNIATGAQIANATWTFLAVSYDDTSVGSEIKIYRGDENNPAVLAGSISAAKGAINLGSAGDMYLGNNSALSRSFDGYMDDVRLLSGTQSLSDIQTIWDQTAPGTVPEPGGIAVLGIVGVAGGVRKRRR